MEKMIPVSQIQKKRLYCYCFAIALSVGLWESRWSSELVVGVK